MHVCEQQTDYFGSTLGLVSTKRSAQVVDLNPFDWIIKASSSSRLRIRRLVPCLYTWLPSYADIEDHRLAFTSSTTAVNFFVLLSVGTSQSLAIHNLDRLAFVRPSLRYSTLTVYALFLKESVSVPVSYFTIEPLVNTQVKSQVKFKFQQ